MMTWQELAREGLVEQAAKAYQMLHPGLLRFHAQQAVEDYLRKIRH